MPVKLLPQSMALWLMASSCALAADDPYLEISDTLAKGKNLWLANCESCHGYGIAGAPIPMKVSHWEQRVIKPRQQLYNHAINGFFGPDDTYMPARGGNDALTDNEVELAVDYMVALATHYLTEHENSKESDK